MDTESTKKPEKEAAKPSNVVENLLDEAEDVHGILHTCIDSLRSDWDKEKEKYGSSHLTNGERN